MELLRDLAPLFNLLLVPAVIGIYRIGQAQQRIDAFMQESLKDRAGLRAKIEPMERALLSRGILSPD